MDSRFRLLDAKRGNAPVTRYERRSGDLLDIDRPRPTSPHSRNGALRACFFPDIPE